MIDPKNKEAVLDFAETIHGWMTRKELSWLYDTAKNLDTLSVWVEVGSWRGRSLVPVACAISRRSTVVSVDPTDQGNPPKLFFSPTMQLSLLSATINGLQERRMDLYVVHGNMTSTQAAATCNDTMVDVVFLDALHTYEAVSGDIEAWKPKLRSGGLLCGHDYGNPDFPGVKKAVDEKLPGAQHVPGTYIWWWKNE